MIPNGYLVNASYQLVRTEAPKLTTNQTNWSRVSDGLLTPEHGPPKVNNLMEQSQPNPLELKREDDASGEV